MMRDLTRCSEQTENKAMKQTNLHTHRTVARLPLADHMNRFIMSMPPATLDSKLKIVRRRGACHPILAAHQGSGKERQQSYDDCCRAGIQINEVRERPLVICQI
jgi:hypothetical protein